MLRLEQVTKAFGPRPLLNRVSLVVNAGEVVGVVGPNGSGKTTLLRIAAGELPAGAGRIEVTPGCRIAYLAQALEPDGGETVAEHFPALFPAAAEASLITVASALAAAPPASAAATLLQQRYDALLAILESPPAAAEGVRALGVDQIAAGTLLTQLSGGELAKLALAALLATPADVLLLDEPTNHLDLAGITWIEERLRAFAGAAVVVSHDRALLDDVADALLVLDGTGGAERFVGGYTEWMAEQERRRREQWEAYGRQQRDERRLKRAISAIESRSRAIEQSTTNFAIRKKAKKIARRSTTLKARMERQATSATRTERPGDTPHGVRVGFAQSERSASRLLSLTGGRIEVGGRVLLDTLDLAVERGRCIALVGTNGSGKSTLLRTLAGEITPAAGSLSLAGSAVLGYLAQDDGSDGGLPDHAPSDTALDLARRATDWSEADATNFLHRVLLGRDQVTTPIDRLSHGERRRLALALLMLRGCNVLLLDEPTNHLDLPSREAMEASLAAFEGAVVMATHDRFLVRRLADAVWSVEAGRIVTRQPDEL